MFAFAIGAPVTASAKNTSACLLDDLRTSVASETRTSSRADSEPLFASSRYAPTGSLPSIRTLFGVRFVRPLSLKFLDQVFDWRTTGSRNSLNPWRRVAFTVLFIFRGEKTHVARHVDFVKREIDAADVACIQVQTGPRNRAERCSRRRFRVKAR